MLVRQATYGSPVPSEEFQNGSPPPPPPLSSTDSHDFDELLEDRVDLFGDDDDHDDDDHDDDDLILRELDRDDDEESGLDDDNVQDNDDDNDDNDDDDDDDDDDYDNEKSDETDVKRVRLSLAKSPPAVVLPPIKVSLCYEMATPFVCLNVFTIELMSYLL